MSSVQLATKTEGYSGADLELVCRESAMMPVRRMMKRIEELDRNAAALSVIEQVPEPPPANSRARGSGRNAVLHGPAVSASASSTPQILMKASIQKSDVESLLNADPVTFDDITSALATTKPSSDGKITKYDTIAALLIVYNLLFRYEAWQRDFGSV